MCGTIMLGKMKQYPHDYYRHYCIISAMLYLQSNKINDLETKILYNYVNRVFGNQNCFH